MSFEERRFGHRQAGSRFVIGFVLFWGLVWTGICLSPIFTGQMVINDVAYFGRDAVVRTLPFLPIGPFVIGVGIFLFLKYRNEVVEVTPAEIRWTDWRGKLRVQASLRSARLRDSSGWRNAWVIETEGGQIPFPKSLSGADELVRRLERIAQEGTPLLPSDRPRNLSHLVPELLIFSMQDSSARLSGYLVLAVMFGMAAFPVLGGFPFHPYLLVWWAICASFCLFGLSLILSAKQERIEIDREGLRWIDWRSRTRIHATLDEITGFTEQENEGIWIGTIATRRGDVTCTSRIGGYAELKALIRRLVEDPGQP